MENENIENSCYNEENEENESEENEAYENIEMMKEKTKTYGTFERKV